MFVLFKLNNFKTVRILIKSFNFLFSIEDLIVLKPTTQSTTITSKPVTKPNQSTTRSAVSKTTTTATTKTTTRAAIKTSKYGNDFDPAQIPACSSSVDAFFYSPENNIRALVDGQDLWEYNMAQRLWQRKDLFKLYPGIQSGVRGGFRCKNNLTWFFKHKKMWAYKSNQLVAGFPKRTFDPLFPNSLHAVAAMGNNSRVYLLKGSFLIEFSTASFKLSDHNVMGVRAVFPGLPNGVEASFYDQGKRELLFFKDKW